MSLIPISSATGFELGTDESVTVVNIGVVPTPWAGGSIPAALQGKYAAELVPGGLAYGDLASNYADDGKPSYDMFFYTHGICVYYKRNGPPANQRLFTVETDQGNDEWYLEAEVDGSIKLVNAASAATLQGPVLEDDKWYAIQALREEANANPCTFILIVDGVTYGPLISDRSSRRPRQLFLGDHRAAVTTPSQFDDLVVMRTDADLFAEKMPHEWHVCERIPPTGTINNIDWNINNAPTVHEAIDENPHDAYATYVNALQDGAQALCTFPLVNVTDRILAAAYFVTGLGTGFAGIDLVREVERWSSGFASHGPDWAIHQWYHPEDPFTGGGDWTPAKLEATGQEIRCALVGGGHDCTQIGTTLILDAHPEVGEGPPEGAKATPPPWLVAKFPHKSAPQGRRGR